MSTGGTEAFPGLGRHCSYEFCSQLDFLPFQCDSCTKIFCLDHRSYISHNCPKAGKKDVNVLLCPICASAVRQVFGEDPNVTIEKHITSGCDPQNYDRVMKKPKCPVKGCREPLSFSNKVHCKACNQDVCLKHRFPVDHTCRSAFKGKKESSKLSEAFKFLNIFDRRSGTECGSSRVAPNSSATTSQKNLNAH